jgi:hypothetical protein
MSAVGGYLFYHSGNFLNAVRSQKLTYDKKRCIQKINMSMPSSSQSCLNKLRRIPVCWNVRRQSYGKVGQGRIVLSAKVCSRVNESIRPHLHGASFLHTIRNTFESDSQYWAVLAGISSIDYQLLKISKRTLHDLRFLVTSIKSHVTATFVSFPEHTPVRYVGNKHTPFQDLSYII